MKRCYTLCRSWGILLWHRMSINFASSVPHFFSPASYRAWEELDWVLWYIRHKFRYKKGFLGANPVVERQQTILSIGKVDWNLNWQESCVIWGEWCLQTPWMCQVKQLKKSAYTTLTELCDTVIKVICNVSCCHISHMLEKQAETKRWTTQLAVGVP